MDEPTTEISISLTEVKELRDELNQLLDAAFFSYFDSYPMMLTVDHHPGVTHPQGTRSDIEELLDLVATASPVLRMPEDRPALWSHMLGRYSAAQLAVISEYRRKQGLPAILPPS